MSNQTQSKFYIVLLVLDEEGNALRQFLYPAVTRPLADLIFDTAKKRVEGYR